MKTKKKVQPNDLTVYGRMEIVIKSLHTTPNKFAIAIGMASTQIYAVINGRNSPSHKMYESIATKIPHVNIYYLLIGRGEPLRVTLEDTLDIVKDQRKEKKKVKNK